MPILGDIVKVATPVARTLGDYWTRRRSLNNATNTVTTGANNAGQRISDATNTAIQSQNDALKRQSDLRDNTLAARQGAYNQTMANRTNLYNTSINQQKPYQTLGEVAVGQYGDLLKNPASFDPKTVMNEPGYQFGLNETIRATDRAGKGLFNRAQLNAKTQNVLDFATTRYNDAFQRYMATQQRQDDLIKGGVGIGQNANAAVDAAGRTYGDAVDAAGTTLGAATQDANNTLAGQVGANADKTGQLGVNSAEDQAALDLARAEAEATNQTLGGNNTANTLGKLVDAAPGVIKGIGGLLKSAPKLSDLVKDLGGASSLVGGLGATAGGVAGLAAPTAAELSAVTSQMASLGIGTAAPATTGGVASVLSTIAPFAVPAAAALALYMSFKPSANDQANIWTENVQTPFGDALGKLSDGFDQAKSNGTLTPEHAANYLQLLDKLWADYNAKADKWIADVKNKPGLGHMLIKSAAKRGKKTYQETVIDQSHQKLDPLMASIWNKIADAAMVTA